MRRHGRVVKPFMACTAFLALQAGVGFVLRWQPDDPVEVFYGEYLLAHWVLEHSPWNAYHSGLLFTNNATGKVSLFDFSPKDTSSMTAIILPVVKLPSRVRAWLLGDIVLRWRNEAEMRQFDSIQDKYENFVRLGRTNGSIANRFAEWASEQYGKVHVNFEPLEVITIATGETSLRSHMCHDFVTDALWFLYREGVRLLAEGLIFRDHIIMYAKDVEPIGDAHTAKSSRVQREWLRHLRVIDLFRGGIADQFTYGRHALAVNWKMGLPAFLRSGHLDYRVRLAPPYLNYCYLPLPIPPKMHSALGSDKLCALAMEANATNTTVPWPWGALLATEQGLDRPESLGAVLFIALVATFWATQSPLLPPPKAPSRESPGQVRSTR